MSCLPVVSVIRWNKEWRRHGNSIRWWIAPSNKHFMGGVTILEGEGGGRALPYLKMVGNFRSIDSRFRHFPIPLGPFSMPNSILLTPSFCRKIGLSLSHLVPEIIWHKICIFFHKYLSFDTFEAICTHFPLDFRSYWPPFSLLLDLFDPSFLQNLRSRWVHLFIVSWTSPPKIWWSLPLSPHRY